MNLYETLISQAPDIDVVLSITRIRPNAKWSNNALIEDDFKDLSHNDELPSVQDILEAWDEIKSENEAKAQARTAYQTALSQGFNTGLGFRFAVGTEDQNAFSRLMIGLQILNPPDNFPIENVIKDINGEVQNMNYGQLKNLMRGYILHCMTMRAEQ